MSLLLLQLLQLLLLLLLNPVLQARRPQQLLLDSPCVRGVKRM
jgi:hypothetical protein